MDAGGAGGYAGSMTDEPTQDEGFDTMLGELEEAGYVEQYTNAAGEPTMRLTASGTRVARQLAMVAEEDAAALMAGLMDDELEGESDDGP